MPIYVTVRAAKLRQGRKLIGGRQDIAASENRLELKKRNARKVHAVAELFHLPLSATRSELLDDGGTTDHRFRQLLFDFSTLGCSLEIARAHLASLLGLSSPQYNIAMILANHQNSGGICVSDIAKRLHVSTAYITGEAGKLEQAGLVDKRPNPSDGRGILLRLSTQGAALVQRVGVERQVVNDHLFGSLSEREFRNLSKTLSALIDDFSYTLSLLKHVRTDPSGGLAGSEGRYRNAARYGRVNREQVEKP